MSLELMKTRSPIRDLRHMKGWTQAELARKVGVSMIWIHKIENGEGVRPGYMTMLRIARVLGVSIEACGWEIK
jgi:transcriptional regulator with XRE-family HTH domain